MEIHLKTPRFLSNVLHSMKNGSNTRLSTVSELLSGQVPRYRCETLENRRHDDVRRHALYTPYIISETDFFHYKMAGLSTLTALFMCDTQNWHRVACTLEGNGSTQKLMPEVMSVIRKSAK